VVIGYFVGEMDKEMSKIKLNHVYHVLRYEYRRVWWWRHQRDRLTGNRIGLWDAIKATIENPPCFDMMWNYEDEEHENDM